MNKYDYKNICPFKWFVLENFPFIEDDFDALTNWQLFCKIGKEINKIISSQNEVGQAVEDFTEKFITLYNYVHDYFENLDVQDEINHKLDEMVEDGTLDNILMNYANVQRIYSTTVAMLEDATNLVNGMKIKTLGYYNINDGGGADFIITDTTNTNYQIDLENGLYAEMIIKNNTINLKQLGGKPNDATFDNKNYLLKYVDICNTANNTFKLIIPSGEWYFSPTHIQRIGGVIIQGIGNVGTRSFDTTRIKAIDTQDYIWKLGGVANMDTTQLPYASTCTNNDVRDLTFSSSYQINYGCLVLEYSNYGNYDNLNFISLIGTGLYIRSSWENYFGLLTFRQIRDFTKPCLYFAPVRTISTVSGNVSSSSFAKMIFENISGDMIKIGDYYSDNYHTASFVNNQIGEINVENSHALSTNESEQNMTENTDLSVLTPIYLINGNMSGVTIDSINFAGIGSYEKVVTNSITGVNYYFKSLFNCIGGGTSGGYAYDVNIANISTRTLLQILTAINPYAAAFSFMLGAFNSSSNASRKYPFIPFDVLNCGAINVNSFESRTNNYTNKISLPCSYDLYKYSPRFAIQSDSGASNDLKLTGGPISSGTTTTLTLRYPYNYNETKSSKWLIRVKTNDTGRYYFVLRGQHNGENVNTTYQNTLEPETWYVVPISMNFDFRSNIQFINLTSGAKLDTLTYIGFE